MKLKTKSIKRNFLFFKLANNKRNAIHPKELDIIRNSFWKKYEYILIINDRKIKIPEIFDLFIYLTFLRNIVRYIPIAIKTIPTI